LKHGNLKAESSRGPGDWQG